MAFRPSQKAMAKDGIIYLAQAITIGSKLTYNVVGSNSISNLAESIHLSDHFGDISKIATYSLWPHECEVVEAISTTSASITKETHTTDQLSVIFLSQTRGRIEIVAIDLEETNFSGIGVENPVLESELFHREGGEPPNANQYFTPQVS